MIRVGTSFCAFSLLVVVAWPALYSQGTLGSISSLFRDFFKAFSGDISDGVRHYLRVVLEAFGKDIWGKLPG